jgi:hypothetical protein
MLAFMAWIDAGVNRLPRESQQDGFVRLTDEWSCFKAFLRRDGGAWELEDW